MNGCSISNQEVWIQGFTYLPYFGTCSKRGEVWINRRNITNPGLELDFGT